MSGHTALRPTRDSCGSPVRRLTLPCNDQQSLESHPGGVACSAGPQPFCAPRLPQRHRPRSRIGRWSAGCNPLLREVSSPEFVPVAEDDRLVVRLGALGPCVICETVAPILRAIGRPRELAVNVLARQLARAGWRSRSVRPLSHAGVVSRERLRVRPLRGPPVAAESCLMVRTAAGRRFLAAATAVAFATVAFAV